MSAHTPGPWKVLLSDNATPHIMHSEAIYCDEDDKFICAMPAEIMLNYNSFANARLIAAAPEMFELLKYIKKVFDDGPTDGIPEIGTLIQKIEGDK